MTGHKVKLGSGFKLGKGGKVTKAIRYRDASHAIAARKSKTQRVVRKGTV